MPPEADTVMVCGFLGCDLRPFNPLIGALPRMLHLHAAQAGGWMGPAIAQAAAELARRGQQRRQGCLGVYGFTVEPGRVALNDPVVIEAAPAA